jgi:hypothetical protein
MYSSLALLVDSSCRHFTAGIFGDLDPVAQHDQAVVDADQAGLNQAHGQLDPEQGDAVELQGRAVKEMLQTRVGAWLQPERPDQAGYGGAVGAHGHGCREDDQPEKGTVARASGG